MRVPSRPGKEKPAVSSGSLEADGGTRTPDPIITSDVLYKLSYVGVVRLVPKVDESTPSA